MRSGRHGLGAPALALALGMGLGGAADAGPLVSASLQVELGGQTAVFPGAGATGTATSPLSATLGAGNALDGTDVVTVPPSQQDDSPVDRYVLFITANGAGALGGPTPGQVGGAASFGGTRS